MARCLFINPLTVHQKLFILEYLLSFFVSKVKNSPHKAMASLQCLQPFSYHHCRNCLWMIGFRCKLCVQAQSFAGDPNSLVTWNGCKGISFICSIWGSQSAVACRAHCLAQIGHLHLNAGVNETEYRLWDRFMSCYLHSVCLSVLAHITYCTLDCVVSVNVL